jgi:acyl-CoA reductase-like NAD-dependent aldehyde dehydrogenase
MEVMMEETFGPVVGIMKVHYSFISGSAIVHVFIKVKSDEEAVKLMNDSPYGLTASIWTSSEAYFLSLIDSLETGTVYQNRCDYLDPALAWTGVKHSGRGVSLSIYGRSGARTGEDLIQLRTYFRLRSINASEECQH